MRPDQILSDSHARFCEDACTRLIYAVERGEFSIEEAGEAVSGTHDDGLFNAWSDWHDDYMAEQADPALTPAAVAADPADTTQ